MSGNAARMLINAVEKDETRIAVVVDGKLEDYHIARASHETLVGNLYKGRVINVHASLQAAFVDIGLSKNAFLHVSEVIGPGEEPYRPPPVRRRRHGPPRPKRLVQQLIRPGDEVIVQVIRDEFGEKGPSVSMDISLPGRFLVLTPLSKHVGVSRKIENREERSRLRTLLEEVTGGRDEGVGFIIRTAGADMTTQDLQADHDYLVRLWRTVEEKARGSRAPARLYEETEIVLRTVREFFQGGEQRIVIDEPGVHQRLVEFFEAVMPKYRDSVEFYGEATPLFHKYGLERQIEQLHQRSVPLPSGGTIVIEQTEALTAIDVNSGRLVREATPEELALKTNQEAAREVMRQLRLRDLGGIIVVDFIDMKIDKNRRAIEDLLRREGERDRSQTVVLPMSEFCLLQIARQKIRPSVQKVLHDPCPSCGGTGFVKNLESIGLEVMRTLKSTLERADIAVVEARVSPDVAAYLRSKLEDVEKLESLHKKRIHVNAARDLPGNRMEFTCYNEAGEKIFDVVQ